ncbi:MAG: hypothetical protein JST33_11535 [Actinobacteria bacterium]|nr:hypothetical protein [Actinomycetota bacterium]
MRPSLVVGGGYVEFCGEQYPFVSGRGLTIGRRAELMLDEDPRLPARMFAIAHASDFWTLRNTASGLTARAAEAGGARSARLAPGQAIPLVFEDTVVSFGFGRTSYEFTVHLIRPVYTEPPVERDDGGILAAATAGGIALTPSQQLVILALAEPTLCRGGKGLGEVPTAARAAARLGWNVTRFNRKLDNVCDKLDRLGVEGMRGGIGSYATNRRIRLIEYAIGSGIVSSAGLALLDAERLGPLREAC